MKLYQCAGRMNSFDGPRTFYSKRVFRTKEEAEAYMPEFVAKCVDSGDKVNSLFDIEEASTKRVVEIELLETP